MREYLSSFFQEFGYAKEDADCLLTAYDTIVRNPDAAALLSEALLAYERDTFFDQKTQVLARSKKAAEICSLSPFTTDLLFYLCLTKHLKELYRKRGIDLQIYRDSVNDLKWKLWECKAVKGVCGTFVAPWFARFFRLERFALGRLQFEVEAVEVDYEKDGVVLQKGVSKVLNVHIPRTRTPIDKESCARSYDAARAFFRNEVGEHAVFVCASWLLFPENATILSPDTNVYRFMSEYDVIRWSYNEGQDLWRIFDTEEKDPDRLPTDGSLRKNYVEHLKRGGRVGWGYGIKF